MRKYIAGFVLGILVIPFVHVLHAEEASSSVEARFSALETKVGELERKLVEAEKRIQGLEARVKVLVESTTKEKSTSDKHVPQDVSVETFGPGVGTVFVCKEDKTIRVGLPALRVHMSQGAVPGRCEAVGEFKNQFGWEKRFAPELKVRSTEEAVAKKEDEKERE